MPDPLRDLRRSLTKRLDSVEKQITEIAALTDERDRLRAALQALGNGASGPAARPTRTENETRRRASAPPRRAAGRRRAKPGETTAKILAVVGERPGVTAVEVSQVARLAQPTTYTTISRLAKNDVIEEVDLGGRRGWRVKQAKGVD